MSGLLDKNSKCYRLLLAHAPLAPQQPSPQQDPAPDYTCKIPNFTTKLAQAKSSNNYGMIESEPFFSSHGYKMKLLLYLNQAPYGYTLWFNEKWSRCNPALAFKKRYTFIIAQRQNIEKPFAPKGEERFKRPTQRENKGIGILSLSNIQLSTRMVVNTFETILCRSRSWWIHKWPSRIGSWRTGVFNGPLSPLKLR